jgi:Zn-finger protein
MNLLQQWEKQYITSILNDIKKAGIKLIQENIPKIINETSFETRSIKYPNKCPYYKSKISCHPEIPDLNCFLCACPNYDSSKLTGGCKINSNKGKFHFHKNLPQEKVWDCSDCPKYHSESEVKDYLTDNLENIKTKYTKP